MTGGSASRSAGILSRANELGQLNVQSARPAGAAGAGGTGLEETDRGGKRGPPMNWRQPRPAAGVGGRGAEAEAQVAHCAAWLPPWKELEQLGAQSAGHPGGPDRIRELEGEAAALKSEADGKARRISDRSPALTRRLSPAHRLWPPWRRSVRPPPQRLGNWSACGTIWQGTRTRGRALIGDYQEKNRQLCRRSGKEGRLQELARRNLAGPQPDRRTERGEAGPGGRASQSHPGGTGEKPGAAGHGREGVHTGAEKDGCRHGRNSFWTELWETYELSHEAAKRQRVESSRFQKPAAASPS